jgi:hypothetical protein
MKSLKKLKELILEKIDLTSVMLQYKVPFIYDPRQVSEVQYRCPFHGDDNKPSARLYKNTKSTYCWVCHKSWDVVGFIQEKEELSFKGTLNFIIDRYRVDTSSIPDAPEFEERKPLDISMPDFQYGEPEIDPRIRLDLRGVIGVEKYAPLSVAYLMVLREWIIGKEVSVPLKAFENKITEVEAKTCQQTK